MSALGDARDALAARLTAAGLPVTVDPRVSPPAVLVDVPNPIVTAARTWSVAWSVKVVAVPPGDADALDWLLDTVERVLVILGPGVEARPGTVTVNDRELPAYLIEHAGTVPDPSC